MAPTPQWRGPRDVRQVVGGPEPFDAFMGREVEPVLALVLWLLDDPDDAVRITGRAFGRVRRRWYGIGLEPPPELRLRRVALDMAVRRRRVSPLRGSMPSPDAVDEVDRVRGALASLDRGAAQTMALAGVEGLSEEQIAAVLGIPVDVVRSDLASARSVLAERLGSEPEIDQLVRRLAEDARSRAAEAGLWLRGTAAAGRRVGFGQRAVAATGTLVVAVGIVVIALTGRDQAPTQALPDTSTTTEPSELADTTSMPTPAVGACRPGEPRIGIDHQSDRILDLYNASDTAGLVRIIGDGPVADPTLRPGFTDRYEDVAAWVEAAESVGDRLSGRGYGMGEPFRLYVVRENRHLAALGIDRLGVELALWVNQDCELRIEARHPVSAPDPCRFVDLFAPSTEPGCNSPFEPRAGHVAVWTGEELLIFGGFSGAPDATFLTTGLGFDPSTDTWRRLQPAPVSLEWWWSIKAVWAGDRMVVAGRTPYVEGVRSDVVLLSYLPATDSWEVSSPLPGDRRAVGEPVWTGREIVLAGGDPHYPDDTAWAYSPSTATWRQLSDPGIPLVEGLEGVWTSAEAIFVGGVPGLQRSLPVAYDPRTDHWRRLPDRSSGLNAPHIVWTGREAIVYGGWYEPEDPSTVLRYDPARDTWAESAPMPISGAQRLIGAWTGSHLMLWDDTAGGALYDPVSDTWLSIAPSPLTDRCDHSGTWIGVGFVVFGGRPSCGSPFVIPDGRAALYDPTTDRWRTLLPEPSPKFVPATRVEGNQTVLPLTSPDGSRAELRYPAGLDLVSHGLHPYSSGYLPGVGRDFSIHFGAVDDVLSRFTAQRLGEYQTAEGEAVGFYRLAEYGGINHLVFGFDTWTVLVYDYTGAFDVVAAPPMTDEQRATWARAFHGRTDGDGFLILSADPPLRLAAAGEHAGPALSFAGESGGLTLFVGPCEPYEDPQADLSSGFFSWCDPEAAMVVHAQGEVEFIQTMLDELEIRRP